MSKSLLRATIPIQSWEGARALAATHTPHRYFAGVLSELTLNGPDIRDHGFWALSREMLPAQLRAASRKAPCTAVSSALRNRDLSLSVNGAGPRVFVPSSRRCRAISRPASALPIFASVQCLPVGETTRAPIWRQRDASGISDVTQTSAAEMCSAIQSSAASALSPTRTIFTFSILGGRMEREPFDTTKTLSFRRAATR